MTKRERWRGRWGLWAVGLGLCLAAAGCADGTDQQRFLRQERVTTFDELTFEMRLHGARIVGEPRTESGVVCPSPTDPNGTVQARPITVITIEALVPTPIIEIVQREPILCEAFDTPVAIEVIGLPLGAVNITNRPPEWGSPSEGGGEALRAPDYNWLGYSELLTTPGLDECGLIERPARRDEAQCEVCDALKPVVTPNRGESDFNALVPVLYEAPLALESACEETGEEAAHVLCVRPCPCRRTRYTLAPYPGAALPERFELGVVSEVEHNRAMLRELFDAGWAAGADLFVSIGDLTGDGSLGGIRRMRAVIDEETRNVDGVQCPLPDGEGVLLSCVEGERQVASLCNSLLARAPTIVGLGGNETVEESFESFFDTFGPSTFYAIYGKVQLVFLDTAEALLTSAQFDWLDEVLAVPDPASQACSLNPELTLSTQFDSARVLNLGRDCGAAPPCASAPEGCGPQALGDACRSCVGRLIEPQPPAGWACVPPMLAEHNAPDQGDLNCLCVYRPLLGDCGGQANDCDDCFGRGLQGSLCVPPPDHRSVPTYGPRNCMCVPVESQPCPGNFACLATRQEDGLAGPSRCGCTRDADCGPGFTCGEDNTCAPPMRMLFTHTPPLDTFGARNRSFRSRREAARLVSALIRGGVDLVFAGAINTYAEVQIGGIPVFITGGGGADLESLDGTGHHWLDVTVADPFTDPSVSTTSISVQSF